MSEPSTATRRTLRRIRETFAKRQVRARVELHIAFSCPVEWETMTPVADGVRRCDTCKANVHELTGASRGEILARLRAHGEPLCGQVNAREDGRLVFGQCRAPHEMVRGMLAVD